MLKVMKKINLMVLLFFLVISFGGCAQITETVKVIWGSSTRALENARVDAISKTYRCSFNDCFDEVLTLARAEKIKIIEEDDDGKDDDEKEDYEVVVESSSTEFFYVFIKNREKRHLVVMDIAGNVDTTEVGIFFAQPTLTTVKVEISSLSSSAKRKVAQAVFDQLDLRFSDVK